MELTLENIEKVIAERVRPGLMSHGGDVLADSLDDGTLYVKLLGACHGCPSASATMGFFVEQELKAVFPDLKEIALVQGVSDELLDEARRLMAARWEA